MTADQIARHLPGDDGEFMPIPGLVDRGRPPVAAPRTVWTDALVARLIDLAQAGLSNSQIAAALGPDFTGNMVAGKLHRLGGVVVRPERPAPEPKPKTARSAKAWSAPAAEDAGRPMPVLIDNDTRRCRRRSRPEPMEPRRRVSDFKTCQWIADEPSFDDACKCGAPNVAGANYCGPHYARAWSARDPELDGKMKRGAGRIGDREAGR